jgi:MFS family permease
MQYMSQDAVGVVASLLGFLLSRQLTPDQLDAWGWRAIFLLGVVIVPFGLIMRRSLPETLDAPEALAPGEGVVRMDVRKAIALGFVLIGFGSLVSYVLNYFTTYASETLKVSLTLAFGTQIASSLASVISDPLGGWMSDRLGRKPVMLWTQLATVVLAIPAYVAIAHYKTAPVMLGFAFGLSLIYGVGTNAVLVAVTEAMPKHQRSVALGLAYSLGVALLGGSSQFMVAWLTRLTGSNLAPAWYLTAGSIPIVLAILMMPETAPFKIGRR